MRRISTGDQSFTLRIPIDVDRTEVCPMRAIDLVVSGDNFVEAGSERHPDGYRSGGTTVLTVRGFQSAEAARLGFERILHAFAMMHADRLRRAYVRPILDDAGQELLFPDESGKPVPSRVFCGMFPILYSESEHVILDEPLSTDLARTTDFGFVDRIKHAPVGALRYPRDAKLIAACGMSAAATAASSGVNVVLLTTILEMLSELPRRPKNGAYRHVTNYLEPAIRILEDGSVASGAIAAHGLYCVVEAIYEVRNAYAHRGVWVPTKSGMHQDVVATAALEIVRAALLRELRLLERRQQSQQR